MSPSLRQIPTIADALAIDTLLVNDMKRELANLLQLNVRGFRTETYKASHYNSFDILKQSLELLFEFGVSTKSYREAMRTIKVYAQGDNVAEQELKRGFVLFANAAYTGYAGQRHVEEILPQVIFLEGTRPDESEFQRVFRSVGVKPPTLVPPSATKAVFLDEGFAPYRDALTDRKVLSRARETRMAHWARTIANVMRDVNPESPALLRVGLSHVGGKQSILARIGIFQESHLETRLGRYGYELTLRFKGVLLEDVFGRK